jgi:thiamine biosynthesis lipoprotein
MKQTELIMGMPITIEIASGGKKEHFDQLFEYFREVDQRFSTYRQDSEISKINNGLPKNKWSSEMTEVMALCEQTKRLSRGFFDISHNGKLDPSGLVKGWAVNNAAQLLKNQGVADFYIEAGGDIQSFGQDQDGKEWTFGIRNPFNMAEIIKVIRPLSNGLATSGTYIRGQHIYDPVDGKKLTHIKSLTVIGPDIYEADRFATAAFAMGEGGLKFIENLEGFEGYMVDENKRAAYTSGFERFVI